MDDVIAIVETDKVTVDIKSDYSGVLSESLAGVGDTIIVGSDLFKIDTDSDAIPIQSTVSAPETMNATQNIKNVIKESDSNDNHRVPSIKFLGKRALLKRCEVFSPILFSFQ